MSEIAKKKSVKIGDENTAPNNEDFSSMNDVNTVTGNIKTIADDVKFNNEPLKAEVKEKKRRRQAELESESKRLETEEYNRQMHEQRYKRLIHLLNQSKFYASYIVDKIHVTPKNEGKGGKKGRPKRETPDKNASLQEKKAKRVRDKNTYDIREYISEDMEKRLKKETLNKQKSPTRKLNLSEEEIVEELNADVDTEKENEDNTNTSIYFNGTLRDYQKKGFEWLKILYENGLNGILADEMGLGKTVQIIALLSHLIEKEQSGPYLIVAPLSTIPNWMLEFERFAPKIPTVVFHGSFEERNALRRKIKEMHPVTNTYRTQPVVITSFEIPIAEQKFLSTFQWRYIIVDEGQRLKNPNSILTRVLKTFKSMNRVLLTGTPLQNNLAELWSLLNFLLPEIFDDLAVFESWFDVNELQYNEATEKLLKLEEEKHVIMSLREILKPFMLRRVKSDVCLDVPPKKEVIVYAPLTQLQHDLYKAVLNRNIDKFMLTPKDDNIIPDAEDGRRRKRTCVLKSQLNIDEYLRKKRMEEDSSSASDVNDDNMNDVKWKNAEPADKQNLEVWKKYVDVNDRNRDFFIRFTMQNTMMMYKKIVNHPYLVYCPLNSVGLPKIDKNLISSSGKLLVLDAMLGKLYKRGHKVLLFSTMKMILDMLEDYLSLRNYKYVRLDGDYKLDARKENIKAFNEDPSIFLFLISTRAGGVGLNLSAADTVIMYDSDWNPQADIQAMARCHRIGQTRPVVIYKLCSKGTIDEKILTRGEAKRMLEKMVISEKIPAINIHSKETILELKRLLESKECKIVASKKDVFTEAELNELLDRSDITGQSGGI